MKCHCTQQPKLRQTGKTNPELFCPVCKVEYWCYQGGYVTRRPSVWPSTKRVIEQWELNEQGRWRQVKR